MPKNKVNNNIKLKSGGGLVNDANGLSISANEAIFGNGSDGDVTISTNTTLTSDKYYNNLTINSGITLRSGGYRIFVKGILTNNGTISNSGYDGGTPTGGAGGDAGTLLGGGAGGIGGRNGVAWNAGGGGGGGGVLMISAFNVAVEGNIFAKGGNGGNGSGNGSSWDPGSAGANIVNALVAANGGAGAGAGGKPGGTITNVRIITEKIPSLVFPFIDYKNSVALAGGAGGGGGDIGPAANAPSGGGGGGGTIVYFYNSITTAGSVLASGGIAGQTPSPATNGTDGKVIKVQIN